MEANLVSDQDLTAPDIQQLASADALAAFFAGLGYDTSARLPQTAPAMGITAESLRRKVRRIERLADLEHGALQVYLVELDSVTLAAVQGLARVLRNRAGEYLLVLTSDYEQLDFVLLERELPTTPATALSTPRVTVRPRVLTVSRRNPGKVALRVLRRFTNTEADADAQYDKLRSAFAVADWSEPNFNNRALFADYFLNVRLRELPEWQEDPKPALLCLRELYRSARDRLAGADDAVARGELIQPTLEALGFAWSTGKGGSDAPDYTLTSASNGPLKLACLAYGWDRYLDGKDELRDKRSADDNPGARVVSVLQAGAAPWAVVTNGKLWRLYSAAAHSRATSYYEIDLEETLAMADPAEAFRCFWLLFRAEAFQPLQRAIQGERRELAFVDYLLQESAEYARQLGERLKERVFDEVFSELARGFIAHMRSVDGPSADLSQERLDEVFRGTLTLLYRVLFLLYAEARDLLPVRGVPDSGRPGPGGGDPRRRQAALARVSPGHRHRRDAGRDQALPPLGPRVPGGVRGPGAEELEASRRAGLPRGHWQSAVGPPGEHQRAEDGAASPPPARVRQHRRHLRVLRRPRPGPAVPGRPLRNGPAQQVAARRLRPTVASAAHHRLSLELVDFGHAPVFADADTFPCILVACADGAAPSAPSMRYCAIPRAALDGLALEDFAAGHGYEVPTILLRQDGWTPEPPEVARLLEKLRREHRTLREVSHSTIYRGIIPGLTEAFFVDQPTRDRMLSEDRGCESLLRKALRGRNIERWRPHWDGQWLVLLKSSENHRWPWADEDEPEAERIFAHTFPSLHRHLKPLEARLRARQDRGRFWWELRSCSYYDRFEQPKILYQDMGYHCWFAFDDRGYLCNNTCYFLPTSQLRPSAEGVVVEAAGDHRA